MSTYSTKCKVCERTFKTLHSLSKHYDDRHPQSALQGTKHDFFDSDGHVVKEPQPTPISEAEQGAYFLWLSGLGERINSSLHPCMPGRWCRIEYLQLPETYFLALLHQLSCSLYGVRQQKNAKTPIYSRSTLRLSYKVFELDALLTLFDDGVADVSGRALYQAERKISGELFKGNADDLIEMAEGRATTQRGNVAIRPTSKSEIHVGQGEGRATRELEIIWWPNLYTSRQGKLTVRFFVKKVNV